MSKYIKTVPLEGIERLSIELGKGRTAQAVKRESGCDLILNGGLYDMKTGKPVGHLKKDMAVLSREEWTTWGYAWDSGVDLRMEPLPAGGAAKRNYLSCLPLLTPLDGATAPLKYDKAALGGRRGRSAIGLTGDALVLYCSSDGSRDAKTPEGLREELAELGCVSALMLDSGGSSQCDFGAGAVIKSARRVHNYICVWLKKEKEETNVDDKELEGVRRAYMTKNRCYAAPKAIVPKGIMVHSTATPGATAEELRARWDSEKAEVSVHAFIDPDVTLQVLPWEVKAWHCGGSGNSTHIAFEVCEPAACRLLPVEWVPLKRGSKGWAVERLQRELIARGYDPRGVDGSFGAGCEAAVKRFQADSGLSADGSVGPATRQALAGRTGSLLQYDPRETEEYFAAVYRRAVSLCAGLCREFGLDPEKDIVSHAEGYKLGIASNHADVGHWWPLHGKSMDQFRRDVAGAMKETRTVVCPECGHKINI